MNMNLERYENESNLDYKKRLVYGKLIYKTIDCDYATLSEYVFERPLSEDVCRRMMYGAKEAFLEIDKSLKTDNKFDKTVMIINDIHSPYERADLLDIIMKHKDEITTLVIGGDFLDCEAISSFPKINKMTMLDELIYGYNLLKKIRQILDNDQKIILINGNHEERLYKMICKMHEKDLQKFINPNILSMLVDGFTIYNSDGKRKKYEGIEGVTHIAHWYCNIDNKIIIAHPKDFSAVDGKMCEKTVEHFKNRFETFDTIVFGHTHKYSQMKVSRRQGVYVVENGCLCRPQDYADTGKLGYTPQDYCYTIIKYNDNEAIDYNNIKVYHLGESETKQDNYKIFV